MRLNLNISLPTFTQDGATGKARPEDLERLRLREAAREFEGLLVEQMVKEMRDTIPESGLFGEEEKRAREIFQEMLDGEFVRLMTLKGGIGIADYLVRSLGGENQEK